MARGRQCATRRLAFPVEPPHRTARAACLPPAAAQDISPCVRRWPLAVGYADAAFAHGIATSRYEAAYDGFMRWIEPIASSIPYQVSPGNHESECHSPECLLHYESQGRPLSNFSAFNARWAMPFRESGGTSNMWYSFELGPAHFVSVNTETDWEGAGEEHTGDSHIPFLPAGGFGRKGEYLAWLERDLAAADAARRGPEGRPWIIAGGHRPFREIERSHGALFRKYGVDAYFAGHTHSYLRQEHPLYNGGGSGCRGCRGGRNDISMLEVIVGGAGCDEMQQAPRSDARGHGLHTFATGRYASGVLSLNRSTLHWRLVDAADGIELDAVTRAKP